MNLEGLSEAVKVERCAPINPLLRPNAMTKHRAVAHSFHQRDIARMRFGSSLILDPDLLSPQQLDCRDVALIITAMVMVPTQAEHARRIVVRRKMQIMPVDVGERRGSWKSWYPAENAGLNRSSSSQL